MFCEVKKYLSCIFAKGKTFFYLFITSTIISKLVFFYKLFASCVQVFHIISMKYTLFFIKEQLYKEIETVI